MPVKTWLTLGRVSNLPSVWTNILAAVLVAQAGLAVQETPAKGLVGDGMVQGTGTVSQSLLLWAGCLLALSLMYIGGMFLNDAFDADWDRQHKVPRPIALGEVSAGQVWWQGGSMLLLGIGLVGSAYQLTVESQSMAGWFSAAGLAGFILSYNYLHKSFALAPLLMGMCRFGVYFIAALLLAEITQELLIVATGICAYICGVTYSAKNEHINEMTGLWSLMLLFTPVFLCIFIGYKHLYFWVYAGAFSYYLVYKIQHHLLAETRNIGAFIGGLLAGIPLLDGLALASMGLALPSIMCFGVFLMMPRLQRWIAAT